MKYIVKSSSKRIKDWEARQPEAVRAATELLIMKALLSQTGKLALAQIMISPIRLDINSRFIFSTQ
jgi:hypothetical protein